MSSQAAARKLDRELEKERNKKLRKAARYVVHMLAIKRRLSLVSQSLSIACGWHGGCWIS